MIAFPSNPSVNDTYTAVGKTWLWTGTAWQLQPRILTSADITDFATAVGNVAPPTTDASLLTSGTLPDARLSENVTTSLGKADTALQSGAAISSISGLQTALDGKATSAQGALADSALQPGAAISDISGLQDELDAKQPVGDYATLVDGLVPSTQLPSFVDDIIEAANFAALPNPGESGKIYLTLDDSKVFRWSGSQYIEIVAAPGSTDAVPEGSNNFYFTAQRAADAAPVQSVAGRTGEVTLGISDVDGLQTELDGKATSAQGAKADSALQPSLIDGLQAFYKLSDLSDSSGNNRTLTNNGGVTFASGKIGNAAVFDGSNCLTNETFAFPTPLNGFTVSGWVKVNSSEQDGSYKGLITKWAGPVRGEFIIAINGLDINKYCFAFRHSNGESAPVQFPIVYDAWELLTFAVDYQTKVSRVYKNGSLVEQNSFDGDGSFDSSDTFLAIGASENSTNYNPNAQIDAVGIWNRALSQQEVAALYNSGTGLELTGKQNVGNYATLENGLVPYTQLPSATIYSDTAPAHAAGLEWVDTTELRSYRSYNGAWVEIDRA